MSNKISVLLLESRTSKFHDFCIFEPLEPCIYVFYYTERLKKHTRKYGHVFGKYYVCKYDDTILNISEGLCAYAFENLEFAILVTWNVTISEFDNSKIGN